MNELKINLSAKLGEIDEDLKQNITNFTSTLKELPKELFIDIKILIDDQDNGGSNSLKLNLGTLLAEQVKSHFGIEDEDVKDSPLKNEFKTPDIPKFDLVKLSRTIEKENLKNELNSYFDNMLVKYEKRHKPLLKELEKDLKSLRKIIDVKLNPLSIKMPIK